MNSSIFLFINIVLVKLLDYYDFYITYNDLKKKIKS